MKRVGLASVWVGVVSAAALASPAIASETMAVDRQTLVDTYCSTCHNDDLRVGNFSLDSVDLSTPAAHAEQLEKVVLKLRSGMMPPSGMPRPSGAEILDFASGLESSIDSVAARNPNPGRPVLHRLNRTEYRNAIRDLLELEVSVESLLPPDDMSQGFDNMSDVLTISPALLEGYISAAGKISRLAIGDVEATPSVSTYVVPLSFSQLEHVDGAPFGTRGGLAVKHNFPADGEYVLRINLYHRSLGPLFGDNKPAEGEQLEIALNGERKELFDINRKRHTTEEIRSAPIFVRAGPQWISAAFITRTEGAVQDFVMPFEQATADLTTGNVKGLTGLPHVKTMGIDGPYNATGVSETKSRERILTCRPDTAAASQLSCAREILSTLARRAFRRPVTEDDLTTILDLYAKARDEGGDFDAGLRVALQAILADPEFIFRFERVPANVGPGENYRISDLELASRLSFFLWSSGPDDELIQVASEGKLRDPDNLERQTKRLLADPRARTLSTNFASHWLHLQNLADFHPDVFLYPDWDTNLNRSMKQETLLFFDSIVREDRSVRELLTADYTFVDGRLALHYGIADVLGNRFRRTVIDDPNRRGLLGHASILSLTSLSNRTSPVVRGAWILDVLLGAPPPTPPADVPPLEENEHGKKLTSVRERLEEHRANPVCASCHDVMDPIGYSLENFDPVGAWRAKDTGFDIDPSGELFDGTEIKSPADLRAYLLRSEALFVRNFSRNLLMYGLGRVVQHYDMPAVRKIAMDAEADDYRFSSFVLGIIRSTPFQMKRAELGAVATDAEPMH